MDFLSDCKVETVYNLKTGDLIINNWRHSNGVDVTLLYFLVLDKMPRISTGTSDSLLRVFCLTEQQIKVIQRHNYDTFWVING